jgi:dihydroorotate dehydrogenase
MGFFGEGYWFHDYLRPLGLDFHGTTFVAKTTTLLPNAGNMPLDNEWRPIERRPKCVIVKPLKGVALNSVGLAGPGAEALFDKGKWQKRINPFFLSFMSIAKTADERKRELCEFVKLFASHLEKFRAPFSVGLQINFSCPNVGVEHDEQELVDEVLQSLRTAATLGVPLVPKFNVLFSAKSAKKVNDDPNCDGICISNTIPWGKLPDQIDWEKLFGSSRSPLAHLGGGGLSGKPLFPLLINWMIDAQREKIQKPISAGGGILSLRDARYLLTHAGASSVFLGSIAFLRPWRVSRIIRKINAGELD